MKPEKISANEEEARSVLADFTEVLEQAGYPEVTDSFFPRSGWTLAVERHPLRLDPHLARLMDLLLLSRPVAVDSLPPALQALIDPLADLGLLSRIDDSVRMPDLTFSHMLGMWLFLQREMVNPAIYFGDDSLGLATRLRPKRGGTSLDLCSGPATQALISARTASRVTALEANPLAASIAQLNVLANGVVNVDVVWGDLYDFEFEAPFDHISANPPLLPVPSKLKYPFVGDGGDDGLRVTSAILGRLPTILAEGGRAQIIGSGLCADLEPCFAEDLRSLAEAHALEIHLTILGRVDIKPGSAYLNGLAQTVVMAAGTDLETAINAYTELVTDQKATNLCSYALWVRHGAGELRVRDLSLENRFGLWQVW